MSQKQKNKNGITEGVIWKQLLLFFFPIVLGTFFQQLYNTADAVVVGQFVGKEALAAVGGSTSTIINLLVGFFVGLSSGATVIISQYFGGGRKTHLSRAVHTAIALAIAGGAVIMVIGMIGAPGALEAMGTPPEVLQYSVLYIRIYFVGMIPSLIYNLGSDILRAVGDAKRPMYFLIICCMLNIFLDLLFVVVIPLGVLGVALGTLISQVVSAVLVLFVLLRTKEDYRLELKKIRFDVPILKNIVQIGLPAGLQSAMYNISNVIIQSSVNTFGTDTIAAWTAYGKIDSIFWMIMDAFGISITTCVGQNFGAQNFDRMKKSVWVCLGMAITAAVALSVTLFFGGQYIYRLFSDDGEVISIGLGILRFMVPTYVTYVCIAVLSGAMRGAGESLVPMLLTAGGICVLRVVWIWLAVPVVHDIKTVIFSYPLTWAVTSCFFLVYYLRGGWLARRKKALGYPLDQKEERIMEKKRARALRRR